MIQLDDQNRVIFNMDGKEYEILQEAAARINNVHGLSVEIGLRYGGATYLIFEEFIRTQQSRTHIAIDPYGCIPYILEQDSIVYSIPYNGVHDVAKGTPFTQHDYDNTMMKDALCALYYYLKDKPGLDFYFFPMEDTEFMKRYDDGIPLYLNGKKYLANSYALVFFDGPHTTHIVMNETRFFTKRASQGAVFVYDDTPWYEHSVVEEYLFDQGWQLLTAGDVKKSYVKQ